VLVGMWRFEDVDCYDELRDREGERMKTGEMVY